MPSVGRELAGAKYIGHRQDTVDNYDAAIASAIAWLGDRYLLAKPINEKLEKAAASGLARRLIISASCRSREGKQRARSEPLDGAGRS